MLVTHDNMLFKPSTLPARLPFTHRCPRLGYAAPAIHCPDSFFHRRHLFV